MLGSGPRKSSHALAAAEQFQKTKAAAKNTLENLHWARLMKSPITNCRRCAPEFILNLAYGSIEQALSWKHLVGSKADISAVLSDVRFALGSDHSISAHYPNAGGSVKSRIGLA
jgi:hypothetical protein